ncbi:MAG TPA: hypothetical protein PLL15_05775 [Syntrophales bacterium]|nr:hypothetical protein [Syntrophales bacterium]
MRSEFTGMLPGAIEKFEALHTALATAGLNPRITGGYAGHGDDDDLRTWGVVCNITCDDMDALSDEAANLGIVIQEDGSLAYTNGLTLDDFKTYRVQADLTLAPEQQEVL